MNSCHCCCTETENERTCLCDGCMADDLDIEKRLMSEQAKVLDLVEELEAHYEDLQRSNVELQRQNTLARAILQKMTAHRHMSVAEPAREALALLK